MKIIDIEKFYMLKELIEKLLYVISCGVFFLVEIFPIFREKGIALKSNNENKKEKNEKHFEIVTKEKRTEIIQPKAE